jgi:hypothetical protein
MIPHGGDTALMFSARVGDLASAQLLVDAGANVNDADAWDVRAALLQVWPERPRARARTRPGIGRHLVISNP